jgi:mxaK protein
MNKLLHLLHGALLAILIAALFFAFTAATQLYQTKKLNELILDTEVEIEDALPKNLYVEFAHAYYAVEQNDYADALHLLTNVITTKDDNLKASAHFNRGNINLRQAQALQSEDPKIVPLIELAKQDYRTALLLQPDLWDVRYNLELALHIVPEIPEDDGLFEKPIIDSRKSIESVGFKVDLP